MAFSYVTRRPPDGYTIGHAPVEIAMVRSLGYADVGPRDMSLICMVSKTPPALVVESDSPWRTFDDFIAAAKQKPGGLIMANSGTGSIWHFNTLLLEQHGAGMRFDPPALRGQLAARLVALLGGHVDAVIAGVERGDLARPAPGPSSRAWPIFDEEASERSCPTRRPPTSSATRDGRAGVERVLRPGRPLQPQIRQDIAAAFREAYETPEWAKLCSERGMQPQFLAADEFEQFARSQAEFFGEAIPRLLRMKR